MADGAGQGAGSEVVTKWRTPLETTALILLAAIGFSIVGGIVNAVFTPGASAWRKLTFLGFNVVSIWHVAVLIVVVGLVLALRIPFAPDAQGASTARLVLLGTLILAAVIALAALIACIGALGDNEAFVGLAWPEKIGNIMQWLGGAAVAGAAALLALRGQSALPAPVRPAPAAAPAARPARRLRRPRRRRSHRAGPPIRTGVTSGATGTAAAGPTRSPTARRRAPTRRA